MIPDALEITVREKENEKYYIYQNFGTEAVNIPVPEGRSAGFMVMAVTNLRFMVLQLPGLSYKINSNG